jgi:hypothetical protein
LEIHRHHQTWTLLEGVTSDTTDCFKASRRREDDGKSKHF